MNRDRNKLMNRCVVILCFGIMLTGPVGCGPGAQNADPTAMKIGGTRVVKTGHSPRRPSPAVRTVDFPRSMNTAVMPALLAESFNGLAWVEIPTSGTEMTWKNDTSLHIGLSWNQFPENASLRLTLSGLKDAAGSAVPDSVTEFQVAAAPVLFGIADTGQSNCYDVTGIQPCSQTSWPGQDGDFANVPLSRDFGEPQSPSGFSDDLITADRISGIVWKTCTEGLKGSNCAKGSAKTFTWNEAMNTCAGLNDFNQGAGYAGFTGWRLPRIAELERLVNFGKSHPAIDDGAFPGTISSRPYWSSSAYGANGAYAWAVFFEDGDTTTYNRRRPGYVRCVTGE